MKCRLQIAAIVFASIAASSASGGDERVGFNFQRGLDFYRWGSTTAKDFSLYWENFSARGDMYVLLRQPPGFPDQWKTSINFGADWSKPVFTDYRLTGSVSSEYFSDQEVDQPPPALYSRLFPDNLQYLTGVTGLSTGLDNRIMRHSASLGLDLLNAYHLEIKPSAGIYSERIQTSSATGPMGNLTVEGKGLDWGGFISDINASAYGQFLENRTNREINTGYRAWREYSEHTSNLFSADYRNYVREFPLTASSQIDRRTEEEFRVKDELSYRILEPLDFILDLQFARRKIEPSSSASSNNLHETSTGLAAGMSARLFGHSSSLTFSAAGQNQDYPSRIVEGRQYRLDLTDGFVLLGDSLKLIGMLSRNQYDVAPDLYSIDTRDELRHSYRAIHYHNFAGGLSLQTELRADMYHLVYLQSERSADNNWERFFLFSPEVRYNSSQWSSRSKFRVSADYIDYDFPDASPVSRVFRKFSADDSLHIRITKDYSVRFQHLLLLEDQGNLDWDAFVQQLSDEYRTNDLTVTIFRKYRGLDWGLSWSYYHRQAYHTDSAGDLTAGERVISRGPGVTVKGSGPYRLTIELSASSRRIEESAKAPYYQTLIDFSIFKYL